MSTIKPKLSSIYRELLKSFSIILIIFLIIFLFFATKIIFTRLEANINKLLDKSLTIAWDQYSSFPEKYLPLISHLATENIFSDHDLSRMDQVLAPLSTSGEISFWCLMDEAGEIITSSYGWDTKNPFFDLLSSQVLSVTPKDKIISSTELIPISYLEDIDPALAKNASVIIKNEIIQTIDVSLFQILALPCFGPENDYTGHIVVGHILNNDTDIHNAYSQRIPDSFLSISTAQGVRVSTNLKTDSIIKPLDFVGSHQDMELIKAIKNNRRFVGQVQLAPGEIHFVTADPIHNIKGEVIGSLTVGVPSWGLASLKKDTMLYMIAFTFLCVMLAIYISSIISKRFSAPIIALDKHAQKISKDKNIIPEILELTKTPTHNIKEISHLQRSLNQMARSLYEKTQENKLYLTALEKDKNELHRLTIELQAANQLLEKKVEERTSHLRKVVMELREANNLKTKFLANMSHEIRTPLNSIIGFTEMLHDEIYGEVNITQKEYLQIIQNSAHHLLELINDILDLSLIDQDKMSINKQEVDIVPLIQSVNTIVSAQIENKELGFSIEKMNDLPVICADPTRIKQILYNLLSNAIKFTPPGGTIKIKIGFDDKFMIIKCQDTGIGIKEQDLNFVFDEFYQTENLYERKFEGVGLGLPLTKKLVELHLGHLKIASEINRGTEITVYLPLDMKNCCG